MPLSSDPEKRQAQLDRLAAGREIAKARRAAGLPTKRKDQPAASGGGRVVSGSYGKRAPDANPAAKPAKPRRASGATGSRGASGESGSASGGPGRVTRFLGRVMGIED